MPVKQIVTQINANENCSMGGGVGVGDGGGLLTHSGLRTVDQVIICSGNGLFLCPII